MTARDRFTIDLFCPNCLNVGTANLSQEDGWSFSNGDQSTRVDRVSEGFAPARAPKTAGGVKMICSACNISVWPLRK